MTVVLKFVLYDNLTIVAKLQVSLKTFILVTPNSYNHTWL